MLTVISSEVDNSPFQNTTNYHLECTNRGLQALDSKHFVKKVDSVDVCTTLHQVTSFIDIKHKAFCEYTNNGKFEKQQPLLKPNNVL